MQELNAIAAITRKIIIREMGGVTARPIKTLDNAAALGIIQTTNGS